MQETPMNISNKALPTTSPVAADEEVIVVEIKATGLYVDKRDIRELLGINTSYRWYELIAVCCLDEKFEDKYNKSFRRDNKVSRSIARKIITKAYDGDKVKVIFSIN